MKNIKKISICISISMLIINSIILLNCFGNDKQEPKYLVYEGITLNGKLVNGDSFEASITLKPYKSDGSKYTKNFWGYDKEHPTFLIEKLKFIIGGAEVNIPKKAFEDLADINLPSGFYLIQIMNRGDELKLVVEGGDAAGSYTAELLFEISQKTKLVSRTISFINSEGEKDSITTNY